MDSEREERLLTMLPQIRDPVVLEEFAGLLNLAVRRDVRGNWKHLYRMINMHLTSPEFEEVENRNEVIGVLSRMCKHHLGIFDMDFGDVGTETRRLPAERAMSDTAGGEDTSDDLDFLMRRRGLPPGLATRADGNPDDTHQQSVNISADRPPPTTQYNPPAVSAPSSDDPFAFMNQDPVTRYASVATRPDVRFQSTVVPVSTVSRSAAPLAVPAPQPVFGGATYQTSPQPFSSIPYTPVYASNNPFSPLHPSNMTTPRANLLPQYPLSTQTAAAPSSLPLNLLNTQNYVLPQYPLAAQNVGQSHGYPGPVPPNYGSNILPQYPLAAQTAGPAVGQSGLGATTYGSNVGPTVIRTKELKLNGQIGEPGEAGKLNYGSLFYQITAAKARKYPHEEIIAAVIKAITPNLPLRNHLERKRDLTLESMLASLRGHFLLTSATKTFTAMGKLAQKPGQREVSYCHEVMAMRDDVLALSAEEGGDYTEKLVQNHLQHVLSVGFAKPGVRHEMRAFLKTPSLADQAILDRLRDIVVDEKEHEELSAAVVTPVAVNAVTAGEATTDLLLDRLEHLTKKLEDLSTLPDKVDRLDKDLKRQQRGGRNPFNGGGNGRTGGGHGNAGAATNMGGGNGGVGNGGVGNGGGGNGGGGHGGAGNQYGTNSRQVAGGWQCLNCGQVGDRSWDHCYRCCGTGHRQSQCPKN